MPIPIIIVFVTIITVAIILLFYKSKEDRKSGKRISASKLPNGVYTRVKSEPRTMESKKELRHSVMCSTVENKRGKRFNIFSTDVLPDTFEVRDGRIFANRFSNPEYKWPGT